MKRIMFFLSLVISSLSLGIEVEDKTFNYRDTHMIVEGRLPVFKDGNIVVSTKAVDNFEMLTEIITMEERKFFIEEDRKVTTNFILKSDYAVSGNSLGVESFLVKTYYYTGGRHGMILETPYNFLDGRELSLKDLFKEGVNYKRLLKNKVEEIIIEEDASIFYENIFIEEGEYKFYLKEDMLIILFNPYEIGPHESGIPAFSIPLTDISDHMSLSLKQ